MSDKKISQLLSGGASQAADEYPIARSGANFKVTGANIAAAATSVGTLTSLTVSGNTSLASSSGGVGIGVAAGSSKLNVAGTFTKNTGDENTWGIRVTDDTAMTTGVGGGLVFVGNYTSGGGKASFASIAGAKANSTTANGLGELRFYTTDASSVLQQRAVIDGAGNLAVDTNTLYVDAANNRVGIGTTSPSAKLDVAGTIYATSTIGSTGGAILSFLDGSNTAASGAYVGVSNTAGNRYWISQLSASNNLDWWYFNGSSWASPKMTLDASGNLGLGVTPSVPLHVKAANNEILRLQSSDTTTGGIYFSFYDSADAEKAYIGYGSTVTDEFSFVQRKNAAMVFFTNATERARIDASGNLGIGTSSPTISAAATGIDLYDATDVQFRLHTGVSGTGLSDGFVLSMASDNTVYLYGYENAPMIFATNNTERARITSVGTLNVGTNPDSGAVGAYLAGYNGFAAQISNNLFYNFSGTNATGTRTFYVEGDGDVYNTNGTYGTISDIKHKQDVIDAPSQWDDLKAIRFRKFRMKSDVEANPDAPYLLGVVAQELEQTSPGLIEQHPDFEEQEVTDDDGNVTTERVQVGTTKTVKSSILLMKAAVALQEAMARIESLEARLEALEA